MSGSGISWDICKSAPRSRQITMPATHRSVFTGWMPFLPPNQQRQSTEGKSAQSLGTKWPSYVAELLQTTDNTFKWTVSRQYDLLVPWTTVKHSEWALGSQHCCSQTHVKHITKPCRNWSKTEISLMNDICPGMHVKGKGSPYSITKCRVLELIPVLGSQPAGDVSHKPGSRLPLLSAKPAVTPATLKRAATNFVAWWTEAWWVWTVCLRLLPGSVVTAIWTRALVHLSPAC